MTFPYTSTIIFSLNHFSSWNQQSKTSNGKHKNVKSASQTSTLSGEITARTKYIQMYAKIELAVVMVNTPSSLM